MTKGRADVLSAFLLVAVVVAATSCHKDEGPTEPVLKKVQSGGPGLPKPTGPTASLRQSPDPGSNLGGASDDEVHRRALGRAGGEIPEGHGAPVPPDALDGHVLPLKKRGLGSAEELTRALERIHGEESRRRFEEGFRLTFCVDRGKRDLARARAALADVLKAQPDLAEAYRVLAYVALSDQFNVSQAESHYRRAIELRPDYGEVHYALAVLYAMRDPAKASEHFRQAMASGMPDEQGLGRLFER